MTRLALLGYGRFGRALGEMALDSGFTVRAFDPVASVPERLRAASPEALIRGAEHIILAVPVRAIRAAALEIRPHLGSGQWVVGVASVMILPTRDLGEVLGAAHPWAATHPLFGPTSAALGERPLTAVVSPNAMHPGAAAEGRRLWERLGCSVVEQNAEQHDRIMARTHAVAFFLAKGMLELEEGGPAPVAPPSFQALTRTIEAVRADASHLFRSIQSDNPFAAEVRGRLLAVLAGIHEELATSVGDASAPGGRLEMPDLGAGVPDLRETRELIDDTDRDILRLLARREHLARRASRAKASQGLPVVDPDRERALRTERRSWAEKEGLDPDVVEAIYRTILRRSRAVQGDNSGEEKE